MSKFQRISLLIVAVVASASFSFEQMQGASGKSSQPKPSCKVILQGKVFNRATGRPVRQCFLSVRFPAGRTGKGRVENWSHDGNFKFRVEPGMCYLELSELRAITGEMAMQERKNGTMLSQRAEWSELIGKARTPYRSGNRIAIEAKVGQIRTFVFRLQPAPGIN